MRYLGLDLGAKRVGVAVGEGRLSLPFGIIKFESPSQLVNRLEEIIKDQCLDELVIGVPLRLSGGPSAQSVKQQPLLDYLKQELKLPVHLVDERLSSQAASRLLQPQKDLRAASPRSKPFSGEPRVDDLAAAQILQTFLDNLNQT